MKTMMKIVFLVSMIVISFTTGAYEYKHIASAEQGDRFISSLVKTMKFSGLNRTEAYLVKRNLSRCIADVTASKAQALNLDEKTTFNMFVDLYDVVYKYYLYGESSGSILSLEDYDFATEVNYECISEHPDKENTVREYAYMKARPEIMESCFHAGGERDIGCTIKVNRAYVAKYKEENGLK